jgi:uncharacterized protein YbbC (DUF1343 family)/putative cell wall-binding protein
VGKFKSIIVFLVIVFFAITINVISVQASPNEKRLGGIDRYDTAIKISADQWSHSDYVIIASGKDFPDALCASPLSKKYDAPILLTQEKELNVNIVGEIQRLGAKNAYIIGGTGVVSTNIENTLRNKGLSVTRIWGKDRYETSIEVAKKIGNLVSVAIVSGEDFPDAVSVSSIAAIKQMPILLTGKNSLPSSTESFIKDNNISKGYIVGGEGVISANIGNGIKSYKRLWGKDRFATNLAVINEFSDILSYDSIFIATSTDYPDALAGSASASKSNSPIFITDGTTLIGGSTLITNIKSVNNIIVLGGSGAVSELAVQRLITNRINPNFQLGDDQIISNYNYLIQGKNIGIVTNQTGVNSSGVSTIDTLINYSGTRVKALYGPEHGIDGQALAGQYVKSYTHPKYNIPVYSLYGDTRMPTAEMLNNIDVLVFDIQDIGARSYTYMSTLNYCMMAAAINNKVIVVLDRPNPLGGLTVDGPILEDKFKTFVGVDNLPMTHGMTAGELAQFFNRKIGARLTVVPMTGYRRDMIFSDTGLKWIQSSPYIPDLNSVFGYNATGLAEGTSLYQDDFFKWVGSNGINSNAFSSLLNNANLPGVIFLPETRASAGGVRLKITDYHKFNPAKTGIYIMAYAHSLNNFVVPKSGSQICMFDKIMGTDKIGYYLEHGYTPQQIEATYSDALEGFKNQRQPYLLY